MYFGKLKRKSSKQPEYSVPRKTRIPVYVHSMPGYKTYNSTYLRELIKQKLIITFFFGYSSRKLKIADVSNCYVLMIFNCATSKNTTSKHNATSCTLVVLPNGACIDAVLYRPLGLLKSRSRSPLRN